MNNKLGKLVSDTRLYWKRPPAGRYMTYKEIASYAFGGIGAYFLITVIQQLTITVNNFIMGNVIGISPGVLYVIYIISVITGFPTTAIRAHIIDNTRNKKGKYRPYMMTMGIPTAILAVAFVMVPYEQISSEWVKAGIILFFNICFQFFYMFFFEAYENLIYVLSPNSLERSDVSAVKSIVYSIAPSITTAVTPIAAKYLTNGSIVDMRLYRVLFPIYAIVGIFVSVIAYANTQEKIVQAKTHAVQIKFMDAIRAVAKNKYFWIISFAGWLGFLEGSYTVILNWLYEYKNACSPEVFVLIGLIYGNASFWGMLLAPFAIRRFGKKKVLVYTNVLNILFIALMYPVIAAEPANMIWYILICLFMNALVGSFAHILNPSLNGDIRDYQQYVTGERIDGMFGTVGLIGSVLTMVLSGVLPAIYEVSGINEDVLGANSAEIQAVMTELGKPMRDLVLYDVLYLDSVFDKVMFALIAASVVGAVMNVLPYFFYDLTEIKQKGMVRILKIRALFEDYGNNALSDKDLVEAIDLIKEAEEFHNKEKVSEDKKSLKAQGFKGRELKRKRKEAKAYNEKIEVAKLVVEELNKFSDNVVKVQLKDAQRIYAAGLAGLTNVEPDEVESARNMNRGTPEEKKIRKNAIALAKLRLSSARLIEKRGGVVEEFDTSVFEPLFEREDELNEAVKEAHIKLSKAKGSAKRQLKATIKSLKADKKKVAAEIKKVTEENSLYNRLAKPYTDAKRLVLQAENYKRYEEIAAKYDEAKLRAEEQRRLEEEEAARLEAEKEAYAAQLKAERLAAKQEKKGERKEKKEERKEKRTEKKDERKEKRSEKKESKMK